MTTAYNPSTGERIELVNGEWVPIAAAQVMPAVADPDVPPGGMLSATEPPADQFSVNPLNKDFLGIQWPGDSGALGMLAALPVSGSMGAIGGLTSRLGGMAAQVRASPIAAMAKTNPILAEAAGEAAVVAPSKVGQFSKRMAENIIPGVQGKNISKEGSAILNEIAPTIGQGPRALEALPDTARVAEWLGVAPTAFPAGSRAMLDVAASDAARLTPRIEAQMLREQAQRYASGGEVGSEGISSINTALATKLGNMAGMPEGTALSQAGANVAKKAIGKQMDEVGKAHFTPFEIGEDAVKPIMASIDPGQQKALASFIDARGVLKPIESFDQYKKIEGAIGRLIRSSGPEKAVPLRELGSVVREAGEAALGPEGAALLQPLNAQYRAAATLAKPGVLGSTGKLNLNSLRKAWDQGTTIGSKATGEVTTMLEAIQRATTSGVNAGTTGARSMEDVATTAVKAGLGSITGLPL